MTTRSTGTRHLAVLTATLLALFMAAAMVQGCGTDDDTDTGQRPIACEADTDCPEGQLCEEAVCEQTGCADIWAPVCDDQGVTHDNECSARMARATIAHDGPCEGTGTDACEGPNPQGCFASGCPDGERCADYEETEICVPSSCGCEDGYWVCTTDCNGGTCVPDDSTDPACTDPAPAWDCRQTGCDDDQTCTEPPGDGTVCVPTRCECEDGAWSCTEDCGGWYCADDAECAEPNPAGCHQTGCDAGYVCTDLIDICTSSQCDCEDGEWSCTDDCNGGSCVPENSCDTPIPSGCTQTGCDDGYFCDKSDAGCAPSFCGCDEDSDNWICSRDCGGGGTCMPIAECGPNPAGCTQDGCDDGYVCETDDEVCEPSLCLCNEGTGAWACTRDCGGGGTCVPDDATCRANTDCETGELCVRGTCEGVACITLYDPVCGVDGRTYGNSCFASIAHVEVAHEGECEDTGSTCDTPNPAGCTQDGCDEGQLCNTSDVTCAPSRCTCDEDAGHWSCTRDCGGGGTCIPAESAACRVNTDCNIGELCMGGTCEMVGCSTIYEPVCGVDGHTYGNACDAMTNHVDVDYDGPCRDNDASCETPNPAGCTQDGCDDSETCDTSRVTCAPTSCSCDPDSGQWACTRDCGGGGTCVANIQ